MSAPRSAAEVGALDRLLRRQWDRLRAWVELHGAASDERPSALEPWTVAELVTHLGRELERLAQCRSAPPGTVPVTLAVHLGECVDRADDVESAARDLTTSGAPLRLLDERRHDALVGVDELRGGGDPVVETERSPVVLSDLLTSRLVELVVHGDDLARSLSPQSGSGPVDPTARGVVCEVLLALLRDRAVPGPGADDIRRGLRGRRPSLNLRRWLRGREPADDERARLAFEIADEVAWLRLATGRVPVGRDTVARALRPRAAGGELPDLANYLPLR